MKNTKAKFSNKTKEAIYERDGGCCIICGSNEILQFHHVYFGMQSNRGPDRNENYQGVCICLDCHAKCHACSSGEGIRQKCINYLKDYDNT